MRRDTMEGKKARTNGGNYFMEQAQQQNIERADRQPTIPPLPAWPTSQPGPKITQPPAGQRRLSIRTEQVVELNYDNEQGTSGERGD